MPELPDLQAFSRNLTKKLSGRKLEKLHAIHTKKLKTTEKELQRALVGAALSSVYREGKEIHFAFDNGNVLGLHLMLRGQLKYFQDENHHRSTIIEMLFDDGTGIAVTDTMKQATATLNPEVKDAPDALSEKAGYAFLKTVLNGTKVQVKKVLMDQNVIRGIGNAYADEILWHAGISPFSISQKIPDEAIRKLAKSIKTVLSKAEREVLKADPDIIGGEVRDFLLIHNPDKTKSPSGSRILKDDSGGRRTYYTSEQKLWK